MLMGVLAANVLAASLVSPAAAQTAETVSNSIGMEFIRIPAGTFMMGSPADDVQVSGHEQPQHEVTISRDFWLGRYEVTQAQWEAVVGSNPYALERSNPYYGLPGMAERITRPDHPATVSWNDAQAFLARLNEIEGGALYRLPSEAEWEYAARAGTATRYSFGDDEAALAGHAWYGEGFGSGGHHPVGTKQPNLWGLYDIHGNVWEWTGDWFSSDWYAQSPGTDPQGPQDGVERVVRGGSWHSTGDGWRSAARRDYDPDYRGISIGFRVLREVE